MESLITNSSKKAVIFAAYNSDIDTNAADKFSLIVDKYDHEIDIFSVAPSSAEYTDFYYLVDKKTKKREEAVILVPYYNGDNKDDASNAEDTSKLLMKYGADFDVFFFSYESGCTPLCQVCDMSTGKWEHPPEYQINQFMRDRYGV
ncbi:hypothetical protein CAEBREN_18370 [Caenorhabditis brenneri]|uniref:Uncharacterized protein n=1 Tax=Caenorhabditis brenneri TaxID=135651 RepID=G0MUZ4_CAEBE|nr:hypothetical protein CAEBREN_18370 [Caenorhabditis brenneri]